MATVLFVRHGRSTANTAGMLAGRLPDIQLDEHGAEQVRATGDRISAVRLAALVSSPLERTLATAEAIAERQPEPVPVEQEAALLEADYGDWAGRSVKDLAKEPLWSTIQANPSAVTFPGGEPMREMSRRVVDFVRRRDAEIDAAHGAGAVWAVVSHGDLIKALLADALGLHLDQFQRIAVDPASVSVVRYTPGRTMVLQQNTHAGELGWLVPPPPTDGPGEDGDAEGGEPEAALGGGAGPAPQ